MSLQSSNLCRRCMARLDEKEPMDDNNVNKQKLFYVYSRQGSKKHLTLAAIPVSTKKTRDMALQKLNLRDPPLTDKNIIPVRSDELNHDTVFVTVKSMVYCIGSRGTNEVKMFDTNKIEFELEYSCPNMISPRCVPGVVSMSGVIYVFGGVLTGFPWAEFLDTNVPQEKQKWKALKEPTFRIDNDGTLFATTYDARTILIGDSDIGYAMLYNVDDGSSMRYDYVKGNHSVEDIENPVNGCDETFYWITDWDLVAYDLKNHTCHSGELNSVIPEHVLEDTPDCSPLLVHLNDNLFCCFTLCCRGHSSSTRTGIVECTRFLINKGENGCLELQFVGYESYRCDDLIPQLSGAVSIEGSFGGLNKQRT